MSQFPSSGGYLRIQRRDAADADAPDGGWSYLVEQTDGTYQTTTDRDQSTLSGATSTPMWTARSTPSPYKDALPDYPWKCKQVQYRVEQDMCGTYYAGPPVGVHIMGDINTPWTVDGVLQEEIEVSKGDYPFKVKLQWGNATDQEQLVDQFRIYRRLYTTHVDTGVGWTQIFSTEDLLTYEDEDLAAGLLYEYKVGALMTCGDGNGNEVSVEFFPPYPNDIGFRSSFGSVSGTILYEDGVTPSGDVRVELQPQGQNDARKSIQLGDDHYIAFDLGDLTENSSLTWPDIHTTQDGEVMTLSQWIKWESTDVGPNPDPLMAANMTNAEGNVIEAFALWGDTADAAPGHYRLNLRQENIRRDFTDIEFKFDEWHHVLLTLEEGTTNGIGYSVTLSAHPDQVEKVDADGADAGIPADDPGEIRGIENRVGQLHLEWCRGAGYRLYRPLQRQLQSPAHQWQRAILPGILCRRGRRMCRPSDRCDTRRIRPSAQRRRGLRLRCGRHGRPHLRALVLRCFPNPR